MYVLDEIDPNADQIFSNLWRIPTTGGEPQQLTFGTFLNSSARFSPDGASVALE